MRFTIWTSHGDYQHYATVDVAAELTDEQALELIQRESPYTPSFTYDAGNDSHVKVLAYLSAVRKDPAACPYEYAGGREWFPGWSWTWIKAEQEV